MRHRNIWKQIASFLTVICCLAGCMIPAQQAGAAAQTPTVVFVNEPDTGPHLFIRKTVENQEEYEAFLRTNPNELRQKFSFTLALNGDFPIRQDYTVLDANGQVVKDSATGMPRTYTALNGVFTLEAGQTACFRNLGVNTSYVVTERPQENFTQVEPTGEAPVTGMIPADGASREFVNRYEPAGLGTTTTLKVHKTVSFVSGYTPPETPDFHFVLTVDGKAWGLKPYTVTDSEGLPAGSGTTDADGRFTLKGGCTASFAAVPALVQYDIAEELSEEERSQGWRVVGKAEKIGPLTAPQTSVDFTNAQASFAIVKEMAAGQSSDKAFTFWLGRADGSDWNGAKYYLYDRSTRQPVEESNPVHETDENGTFQLKQEQMAVFIGVESGVGYRVREVADPDYRQLRPSQAEGYPDETVGASVEPLIFRNEKLEKNGTFSVTKEVENLKSGDPDTETVFRFVVFWKAPESQAPTPTADAGEDLQPAAFSADAGEPAAPAAETGETTQSAVPAADAGEITQSEASAADAEEVSQRAVSAANTRESMQSSASASGNEGVLQLQASVSGNEGVLQPQASVSGNEGVLQLPVPMTDTGEVTQSPVSTADAGEITQSEAQPADTGKVSQSAVQSEGAGEPVQSAALTANTIETVQSAALTQNRAQLQTAAAGAVSEEDELSAPAGYDVASNLSYQIYEGETARPGSTNAQGVFTLKANETAYFDAPPFGQYIVREVALPEGYTIDAEKKQIGPLEVKRGGENVDFTFRNTYREDLADLNLKKTSRTGQTLEGVRFRLYRAEETPAADWTTVEKTEIGSAVSAADGTFAFTGLPSGMYYLEETETIVGYQLPEKPWTITIARAADHTGLTVTVNDPTGSTPTTLAPTINDTDRDQIDLTIQNDVLYALPSTGGMGTAPLRFAGLLLMLAACGLGVCGRRKKIHS